MRVPEITFDESNVGTYPTRGGVRNRIGIVGAFSKGPVNQFTYVNEFLEFANRYGSNKTSGSLSYQAAYDQGARDFGIVRVVGNAKMAKANIRVSGSASKNNSLFLYLKYVGEAVLTAGKQLEAAISTSGSSYNGDLPGRYQFYVSDATPVAATPGDASATPPVPATAATTSFTIKYKLVSLDDSKSFYHSGIDWSTVTDSITVKQNETNVPKAVGTLGLSLKFGTTSTTNVGLEVGQKWMITVNSYRFQIPVPVNSTAAQILTNISDVTQNRFPLGIVSPEESNVGELIGLNFELDETLFGSAGNGYAYYFELDQPDVTLSISKQVNNTTSSVLGSINRSWFVGGQQGATNASKDFYPRNSEVSNYLPVLKVFASSPGVWGNNLRVTIDPISTTKFKISVKDIAAFTFNPQPTDETYTIDLTATDAFDSVGELNQLKTSNLIRAIFVPKAIDPEGYNINSFATIPQVPQRLMYEDGRITGAESEKHVSYYGPRVLKNIQLDGGLDGPAPTPLDYIKAINVLGDQPVHIILAAGVYDSNEVKSALVNQAESSTEVEGLRIAILNSRPNLHPSAAVYEAQGFDSRRAVQVAGWVTYSGQTNTTRYGVSPDGFYAGKLATTPFYAGPHSRTTAGPVVGALEVDTQKYSSKYNLQQYTDGRLEVLALDPARNSFYYTTGRTLSSNVAWEKISIRRTYDIIRQDLYVMLQEYKSEPHTPLIRSQIASAINAYMGTLLNNNRIANYSPAIIDASNNPPEYYVTGELNVTIRFLPIYALDYINITFIRDTARGLSIGDSK